MCNFIYTLMKISRASTSASFKILETTARSQSAVMKLAPKEASSDDMSTHPRSDQTLIVLHGMLEAQIDGEKMHMHSGDSVTVPAGAPHRFVNISDEVVTTFTVYSPPAYPAEQAG